MKRILIVNVNWRGDVIFSTPFIRAVRKAYPESFIASLVVPRCAPILEHNPHLNELIIFDEKGRHKGIFGAFKIINELRERNFDVVFLLHRSLTKTIFCFLAGIPQRIGYYTRKRGWLLTKAIAQPKEEMHKVKYFLNLAQQCSIKTDAQGYEFFTSGDQNRYIEQLLKDYDLADDKLLAVINPGGNWDLKRWPSENFAQLADRLIEQFGAKVLITGAQSDSVLANDVAEKMKHVPIILCGKTSLGELAALMSKVGLVVANDSGPMHIALSQGTNVIALFGPTSPKITGPYGDGNFSVVQNKQDCEIPCYVPGCRDNHCMSDIQVDDVIEAVSELLAK